VVEEIKRRVAEGMGQDLIVWHRLHALMQLEGEDLRG
jgi:hypothetical protein